MRYMFEHSAGRKGVWLILKEITEQNNTKFNEELSYIKMY